MELAMSLIFTDDQRKEFKRAAEEKYAAKEKEFLRTAQTATTNFYRGLPQRYKKGWLRAHLGDASKRQAIAAFCYACVKYKNVQKTVGGCVMTICPAHQYRPLQKKGA
jgi:hypothetical protein